MNVFKKVKSKKKINENKRFTIDELHENKMTEFEEYYGTLPVEMDNLKVMEELYESEQNVEHVDRDYTLVTNLRLDIEKKIKQIEEMKSQDNMHKYLFNVQNIFLKMALDREKKKTDDESEASDDPRTDIGIRKYVSLMTQGKKGDYLEEYLYKSHGLFYNSNEKDKQTTPEFFKCENCGDKLSFEERLCILCCKSCGMTKDWQDPDLAQWSDEVDVSKTFRYDRIGYFIDHLYRMQASECADIPDAVINNVMMELRKNRINDPSKINRKNIKSILKKLNLSTYYDNINSIIRTISGEDAPKFPEDLEDRLVCMFMRTIEPFNKYKHLIPDRNNYLSYPYTIRKLLEIVATEDDDPEILKFTLHFSLLKNRHKTWDQEKIWEKICEYNNWPFVRSI